MNMLSPLDSRYADKLKAFKSIFSYQAFYKERFFVEVNWLHFLISSGISPNKKVSWEHNCQKFSKATDWKEDSLERILEIEAETKHDVKAIELYLQERLLEEGVCKNITALTHFGCTSEDINSVAYGSMINKSVSQLTSKINSINQTLYDFSKEHSSLVMLSRTHGQPATPTTLGKEFAVFRSRIDNINISNVRAKFGGATGGLNANYLLVSNTDWKSEIKTFLSLYYDMDLDPITTQVAWNDSLANTFSEIIQVNNILIDMCRDVWHYISIGYLKQKNVIGEVGSSTMPHKINPIHFENAEGNLELSNSMLHFFMDKLPKSRLQRDLSGSTVMRNIGVALGHALIAYESLTEGLSRITPDEEVIGSDLNHVEVLAEPLNLALKMEGCLDSYDRIKKLTKGKKLSYSNYLKFIDENIRSDDLAKKLRITPSDYIPKI